MAMSEFVPMSWNGEPITTDKLNQMCNNTQYLFDRSPRIRYAVGGVTRDTGLKVLSGKTAFSPDNTKNYLYVNVFFGSFFSAGSNPVVTASIEPTGGSMHRSHMIVTGLAGGPIDQTGFIGVIAIEAATTIGSGGWVNWTAVGY